MIQLGACMNFAVMASSTATCAGAPSCDIIGGKLGVFPGTSITGNFVGVTASSSDGAVCATAALAAWTAGTQDASVVAVNMVAEMGGMTFGPGIHRHGSAINIASANPTVTLDAEGDSDAVFIFVAGSTLTTCAGSEILLLNEAKAENIFWVLGSALTMGADSTLVGTVLAGSAVTIGTNGIVVGRVMAQSAVTCETACAVVECIDNTHCSDGLNHNGLETCLNNVCQQGTWPSANPSSAPSAGPSVAPSSAPSSSPSMSPSDSRICPLYTTFYYGSRLASIEVDTGLVTDIGEFGISATYSLAADIDGTLYALAKYYAAHLATVNTGTAGLTLIGNGVGVAMVGIEIDSSGTMYGVSFPGGDLYEINKTTGTANKIGPTSESNVFDLAFDSNDTLYLITFLGELYTVNTSTAQLSLVGLLTEGNSIMFDSDDTLYATQYYSTNSPLYIVDLGSNPLQTSVVTTTGAALYHPLGGDFGKCT
jgi:hypothetical protein